MRNRALLRQAASTRRRDQTRRRRPSRRRRATAGWIAGPRPNRDGHAPVRRGRRRGRSRFDRGRPRRPARRAFPESRAYSRRRRMSRRHRFRHRAPRAIPPRDRQEPGYDGPIRQWQLRRRFLSSFPRPRQPCRQDAAFGVRTEDGVGHTPIHLVPHRTNGRMIAPAITDCALVASRRLLLRRHARPAFRRLLQILRQSWALWASTNRRSEAPHHSDLD